MRRRLLFVAPLVLAAAGAFWFWRSGSFPPPRGILLITLDTTRADALGAYGAPGDPTPTLDRLAREGVRFLHAWTPVPITLPAHGALFTGRYPHELGVRDNSPQPLPGGIPTLAGVLARAGYRTAAFISGAPLARRWGLHRGFAHYDDRLRPAAHPLHLRERRAGETVAAVLAWSRAHLRPDDRFFLWVHLFDPHRPYDPPAPFRERFRRDPYRGEVAYADRAVGRLLAGLARQGLLADTLIVVTADHGEGLGEHGEQTHGHLLFQATMRVPLIFHWPGRLQPRVVSEAVSLVDLGPTLAQLAGTALPATGTSLVGALRGEALPDTPRYEESLYDFLHFGWAPQDGVRTSRWHLLVADSHRLLFDLTRDPREMTNVLSAHPAVARRLEGARQRFRSLPRIAARRGPLAYAPPTYLQGSRADPLLAREATYRDRRPIPWMVMDRIERFEKATRLSFAREPGALAQALKLLEGLLRKEPDNPAWHYWRGRVLRTRALRASPPRGDLLLAAAEAFRRTLRRRPDHGGAQNLLFQCLLFLGRPEAVIQGAREVIRQGCENRDTRLFLAEAYLQPGPRYDPKTAARINAEALRRYPGHPRLLAQKRRIQALLERASREHRSKPRQ